MIKSISLTLLLHIVIGVLIAQSQPRTAPAAYTSAQVNYITTWDASAPETDPAILMTRPLKDVRMTRQYLDGLGRPLQTVIKQGSLATGNPATDIISPVEYDIYGKEIFKYSPYAEPSGNNGGFRLNPFQEQQTFMSAQYGTQGENYFYSKTNFESSPLNRVEKSMAPGNNWVGNNTGVEVKYWVNTPADAVRIWNVYNNAGTFGTYTSTDVYSAAELYKHVTVDEHGNQVIEFKDKEGKVILKKVQYLNTTDNGSGQTYDDFICTFYIYDDQGNLRCVIQPEGVQTLFQNGWNWTTDLLNEQCFRYEYDTKNRMIRKKVPGAGEVFMVYDARDRLVMSQDANMRLQGNWLVTKYDDLNRPFETGLWTNSSTTFDTHLSSAAVSTNYPVTSSGYEMLTTTHYDDYLGLPSGLSDFLTTWNGDFSATSTIWPYPQMPQKSISTKGMVTWTQTKVLGTSTYLNGVSYYDEKGRTIQVQTTNVTGGTDVMTTQYSWAGQPLVMVQTQEKAASPAQTTVIVTKMTYDDLGRVAKTEKKVSNTLVDNNTMPAYKTISENEYDKLGQLKKKKLSTGYNSNAGLESLTYSYNIRGWMLGINRDYVKDANQNNWFGFDLGYDKVNNDLIGNLTYNNPQYNGNIEGILWKSKGDGEKRKYDFVYDGVNRLLRADFTQYTNNAFNQTAGVNYDMKMGDGLSVNTAYDLNGNIKRMQQWGLTITGSSQIDNLRYNYITGSNKLKSVTDFTNDPLTKLGDFRTAATHLQSSAKSALSISSSQASFDAITDYSYDVNGNMNLDNNKAISSITYNYLNLPSIITVAGKGTISYTYDAAGNKIKKQTTDNSTVGKTITTTSTYIDGMVYESRTTAPTDPDSPDYTDKLQFIPHEEGRIRFKEAIGAIPASLQYDYMLKDHLGNVRMVLTDDVAPPAIYQATIEDANRPVEVELFSRIPETENVKPNGFDSDNSNAKVTKVFNNSNGDKRVGTGIVLKVMAGDKFKALVNSWYLPGGTDNSLLPGAPSILSGLLSALTGSMPAGGHSGTDLLTSGALNAPVNAFLNNQNNGYDGSRPKAFLNWIVLDDQQFKLVPDNYGAIQVPEITNGMEKQVIQASGGSEIEIKRNGYLYVYVSNESQGNVYFDDLRVEHINGPMLEETHYYPFGLTMAGISSRALAFGRLENKRKFNEGTELNNDFGVNFYETDCRLYDPQIGRFWQVDELAESNWEWSPYMYALNNPILYNDPLGLDPEKGLTPETAKELQGVTLIAIPKNYYARQSLYHSVMDQLSSRKAGIDQIVQPGLREMMYRFDGVNKHLDRIHEKTRAFDKVVLEIGAFFIPVSWITKLKYLRYAANLFKFKRAKIVAKTFSARMGKLIGWGERNDPEDVVKTVDVLMNLTQKQVRGWAKNGLTKEWVQQQLGMYVDKISRGGLFLKNTQLLPRKDLMENILKLW